MAIGSLAAKSMDAISRVFCRDYARLTDQNNLVPNPELHPMLAKWERGAAEAATKAFSEVTASICLLFLLHPKSCPDWEDWEKEEGGGVKWERGAAEAAAKVFPVAKASNRQVAGGGGIL